MVTMGRPKFTPKLPISFDDHHPHLIHPSLDQLLSPPQMASGSNQLFCHSSLLWSDRWDKQIFCTISTQLTMLIESNTLIITSVGRQGSLALAGSLSRRRKTLIQNRGSRSPLASPCDGRTHQSSWIFPAIGF